MLPRGAGDAGCTRNLQLRKRLHAHDAAGVGPEIRRFILVGSAVIGYNRDRHLPKTALNWTRTE